MTRERALLVVEDDRAINDAVSLRLRSAGFEVVSVFDGPAAVRAAASRRFDAIVLDLMLPGLGGLDVCREIQRTEPVPVLMLTARSDEADVVAGLAAGADDYLTKPFSPRELLARVEALLRRVDRASEIFTARRAAAARIELDGLTVDAAERRVTQDGAEIALTRTEFDLLLALALDAGNAVRRERLLVEVWGWREGDPALLGTGAGRTVDSHVRAVRAKLGPDWIRTVHGVGYRLEVPGARPSVPAVPDGDERDGVQDGDR